MIIFSNNNSNKKILESVVKIATLGVFLDRPLHPLSLDDKKKSNLNLIMKFN